MAAGALMDSVRGVVIGMLVIALVVPTTSGCRLPMPSAERSSLAPGFELDLPPRTRVAQNNGQCYDETDCYAGYYCDWTGATANCTGKCGLCYRPPSEDDTSSNSSPAPAPSNTSQPQGQGSMWVYLLGTVVLVVLVVVLVSRMNAEPDPTFARSDFGSTPAPPPSPGLVLTFGF